MYDLFKKVSLTIAVVAAVAFSVPACSGGGGGGGKAPEPGTPGEGTPGEGTPGEVSAPAEGVPGGPEVVEYDCSAVCQKAIACGVPGDPSLTAEENQGACVQFCEQEAAGLSDEQKKAIFECRRVLSCEGIAGLPALKCDAPKVTDRDCVAYCSQFAGCTLPGEGITFNNISPTDIVEAMCLSDCVYSNPNPGPWDCLKKNVTKCEDLASYEVEVCYGAPPVPETIIDEGPAEGSAVKDRTAMFTFSSNVSSTFKCSLDSEILEYCPGNTKTLEGLADGEHVFRVAAINAYGKEDSTPAVRTWRIDNALPVVTITSGQEDVISTTSATFTFDSNKPGSSFFCSFNGSPFSSCVSPQSYSDLQDNVSYQFSVKAIDPAGNEGAEVVRSMTVNVPDERIVIGSFPENLSNKDSFTFAFDVGGSPPAGVELKCDLDGADGNCETDSSFQVSNLSDGPHTVNVVMFDAGGTELARTSYSWTVDATPPKITSITPAAITTAASPEEFSVEFSEPIICDNPQRDLIVARSGSTIEFSTYVNCQSTSRVVFTLDDAYLPYDTNLKVRLFFKDAAGNQVDGSVEGVIPRASNNSWTYQTLPPVQIVAAGMYHTILSKGLDRLWAMGANTSGQLGLGSNGSPVKLPTKVTVPGDAVHTIAELVAGDYYSLARTNSAYVMAWGNNSYGQLGMGDIQPLYSPTLVPSPTNPESNLTVLGMSASGSHSMGVSTFSGSIYEWGYACPLPGDGQAQINELKKILVPTIWNKPGGPIKAVVAGKGISVALKGDGTIWTRGSNGSWMLGNGDINPSSVNCTWGQVRAPDLGSLDGMLDGIDKIVVGSYHVLALRSDGTVWSWGANSYGALGHSSTMTAVPYAKQVSFPDGVSITQIAAGNSFSMALDANGHVWTWGYNGRNRLGRTVADGKDRDWTPIRVLPLLIARKVTAIFAGSEFAFAKMEDNSLWVWGDNKYGQLGLGDKTYQSGQEFEPVPVRNPNL